MKPRAKEPTATGEDTISDLKERTIRGGAARAVALAAGSLLRVGSVMILARLLEPSDFGLIGMVTAFTGVLSLFRDFGLSAVTVQRANVSEEQSSTLFWVNVLVGAIVAVIASVLGPPLAAFYHEPRVSRIAGVLAIGFLFNGAGIQHSALLQRRMRFTALALIDIISLVISTAVAIGAAKAGLGYWALVAMAVALPLSGTVCVWLATAWVPGMPHRQVGLASMMRFGGTLTLNGLVMYVASNFDKVLLGRFWGTQAIGIYGRAYQLIRIPTDNLNSVVGEVAFSALSRLQRDPGRLKRYFLKGYSLVLAFTVPATVACALFGEDIIVVLLGPKWREATGIFRLLAPTILFFAIANPLGWLLNSLGMVERGLKIACGLAPLMIGSYVLGLPAGPRGVALAYSAVMTLAVVPLVAWAVHGTPISFWDVVRVMKPPFGSVVAASALTLGIRLLYAGTFSPLPRLMLDSTLFLGAYFGLLLFVAGEKASFVDVVSGWRRSSPADEASLTSA